MENINLVAKNYINVVKAWKKRADVQNGTSLGYHKDQDPNGELEIQDKPKGIGDGLSTTGWCVSASQSLLYDNVFQTILKSRGANAKLVSIDIKEQYYGQVYNGSQNKWHTAILVKDSDVLMIVDPTCAQFGNYFVGKLIWDFETWEKTLRSAEDKHIITDFSGNVLATGPANINVSNTFLDSANVVNSMHDITTINDVERNVLADFFLNKIEPLNKKILIGNLNSFDFKYMDNVNTLMKNLRFASTKEQYYIMSFANKAGAVQWIEKFAKNDYILPQYITTSPTLKDNCDYFGIDMNDVNTESLKSKFFIVIKFSECSGVKIDFIKYGGICIPYGIKLELNPKEDIYNAGKDLSLNNIGEVTKTNTIMINCKL